VSTEAL
jgi:hypothetical protein